MKIDGRTEFPIKTVDINNEGYKEFIRFIQMILKDNDFADVEKKE